MPFYPFFSHIYVEKQIQDLPRTRKILAKFPSAQIIQIDHYKDIFCRSRQDPVLQRRTRNLILAAKKGSGKKEDQDGTGVPGGALLYKGAPVCQNFGHENFYYTSCIMNCMFDCEYCYLKGMYPSANIVIFVNIEDMFARTRQLLAEGPLYLCVSYDTDLAALEPIAGYVSEWARFAQDYTDRLTIEIRTKCADKTLFHSSYLYQNSDHGRPLNNVIYAFTLSPQAVVEAYEHHTPSLSARIACAAWAVHAGFPVRLCFDPMLYVKGWEVHYKEMLEEVFCSIDLGKLVDVSVGTFRISQDYLKNMRRQEPDLAVAWFPYEIDQGVYHYPDGLMERMEGHLIGLLREKMPKEKIFSWRNIYS